MAGSPQYGAVQPRAWLRLGMLSILVPTKKEEPSAPQPCGSQFTLASGEIAKGPHAYRRYLVRGHAPDNTYPGLLDSAVTCAPHETGTYLALVSMGRSLAADPTHIGRFDPVSISDDRVHALRIRSTLPTPFNPHEVRMVFAYPSEAEPERASPISHKVSGVCPGFDLSSLRSSCSAACQNSSSLFLGMPAASQSLYARAAISCSVGFAISRLQVSTVPPRGWGLFAGSAPASALSTSGRGDCLDTLSPTIALCTPRSRTCRRG
jgi:hypothetical protein